MTTAAEIQAKITKLSTNLTRFDGIVNGPATGTDSEVTIDDAVPVKTVARVLYEAEEDAAYLGATADTVSGLLGDMVAARDDAIAAAEVAGVVAIYDSKAAADADVASVANGDAVMVLEDEDQSDERTLYIKAAGVLVYKISLPSLASSYASLALIKAKKARIGDVLLSTLYGGSIWIARETVKIQNTTINWDDVLHQQGTKIGGGAVTWECQVGGIQGWLRKRLSINYARAFAKLMLAGSVGTAGTFNVHGDSIVYGQIAPALTGGDRVATGYGDGSLHEWTQTATPWPAWMHDNLEAVYGSGKIVVNNRGFSGDRVENGYARGRYASAADFDLFAYMTNEVQFATDNGGGDGVSQLGLIQVAGTRTAEYFVEAFVEGYQKLIARAIISGSVPVIISAYPFESSTGYDGSTFASAKLLKAFVNAAYDIGAALDVLVIDLGDTAGQHDLATLTTDGVHPSVAGHEIIGGYVAAPFSSPTGWRWHTKVGGGTTMLTANVARDPLTREDTALGINIENPNSFARPFSSATESADMFVSNADPVTYSFYLDTDEINVMPIGMMGNGGSGTVECDVILDFDIPQPKPKLNLREYGVVGSHETPPSSKTLTSSVSSRHFNNPVIMGDHLRVQGRGWHTVRLAPPPSGGGTFVLAGMLFGDFGDWREVTLKSGFAQSGDVAPAVRMKDGVIESRGIIVCAVPGTTDQEIFDLPAEFAGVTVEESATSETFPVNNIAVAWETGTLVWKTSGGDGTLNLRSVRPLPVTVTAGG